MRQLKLSACPAGRERADSVGVPISPRNNPQPGLATSHKLQSQLHTSLICLEMASERLQVQHPLVHSASSEPVRPRALELQLIKSCRVVAAAAVYQTTPQPYTPLSSTFPHRC